MITELLEKHLILSSNTKKETKFELTNIVTPKTLKTAKNPFLTQFHSIYKNRLTKIKSMYKKMYPKLKFGLIKDLTKKNEGKIFSVGIIKKNMIKFKSYLKTIEEPEFSDYLLKNKINFFSEEDEVFFEDESGKIKLNGIENMIYNKKNLEFFNLKSLTTGCVICLTGYVDDKNYIQVSEVKFLDNFEKKTNFDSEVNLEIKNNNYTAIISNLNLSNENIKKKKFELLKQFLLENNSEYSEKINDLIIFSGIYNNLENKNLIEYGSYTFKKDYNLIQDESMSIIHIVDNMMDKFINKKKEKNNIYILPGLNDINSSFLPQKKFSSLLFPLTYKNETSFFLQNPDYLKIKKNGKIILFLENLILEDFVNQSNLNFYQSVKLFLSLRLLAPTAPNTLEMFPFCKVENSNSLIIEEFPDVVFVGGSETFRIDFFHGNDRKVCEIVYVPSYDKNSQVLIYDFDSREGKIVDFE